MNVLSSGNNIKESLNFKSCYAYDESSFRKGYIHPKCPGIILVEQLKKKLGKIIAMFCSAYIFLLFFKMQVYMSYGRLADM